MSAEIAVSGGTLSGRSGLPTTAVLPQPVGLSIKRDLHSGVFGEPALVTERRELVAQCGAKELIEVPEGHSCGKRFFTKKAERCLAFLFRGNWSDCLAVEQPSAKPLSRDSPVSAALFC